MTSRENDQESNSLNPELYQYKTFKVTGLIDLSGLLLNVKELVVESSCCGSFFSPITGPAGFKFGAFDTLVCEFPKCTCIKCSCGASVFPSKQADDYLTRAGRDIRDFIDDIKPDDWLYQYISVEDVEIVKIFKRRIQGRNMDRKRK